MPLMLTPLAASAEVILERLPGRLCPQTVICFAAIDASCAAQFPVARRSYYQIAAACLRNSTGHSTPGRSVSDLSQPLASAIIALLLDGGGLLPLADAPAALQ